jgi:hypothetical protein
MVLVQETQAPRQVHWLRLEDLEDQGDQEGLLTQED